MLADALLPTFPPTIHMPWRGCWADCGQLARRRRSRRCYAVILPPTPPSIKPAAVADLLDELGRIRKARAKAQAAALAERAAAHACLDNNPNAVARLLYSLRQAGADAQATALTERLPGAGMFRLQLFLMGERHRDRFRFGREANGSPAEPWEWHDLDLCRSGLAALSQVNFTVGRARGLSACSGRLGCGRIRLLSGRRVRWRGARWRCGSRGRRWPGGFCLP